MTHQDVPSGLTEPDPPPLRNRRRGRTGPYLLLVPALGTLVLGLGYPLVRQVVMSFQEFGLAQQFGTADPGWVGFDNYVKVLTDSTTWIVIARSIAFCFAAATLTMAIGMAFALLMRQISTTARIILQISMLAAWASPLIASLTVWNWLFDTRYGMVNYLLVKVGFESFDGYSWLANPWTFFVVAGVIVVWMSVPFVVFSLYAALTQVPEETIEASQLDGASRTQRFRFIILPTIRPVLSIVMLLQIVWDLRLFAQIKYLQGAGGIVSETNLLGTYLYQLGVAQSEYGMASAVAMLMLLLTFGLTFGYVRSLLREERAS